MIVWGGRRHGTEVGLQSLLVLPSMLVFSAEGFLSLGMSQKGVGHQPCPQRGCPGCGLWSHTAWVQIPALVLIMRDMTLVSHLTFSCLNFLICKMGLTTEPTSVRAILVK